MKYLKDLEKSEEELAFLKTINAADEETLLKTDRYPWYMV